MEKACVAGDAIVRVVSRSRSISAENLSKWTSKPSTRVEGYNLPSCFRLRRNLACKPDERCLSDDRKLFRRISTTKKQGECVLHWKPEEVQIPRVSESRPWKRRLHIQDMKLTSALRERQPGRSYARKSEHQRLIWHAQEARLPLVFFKSQPLEEISAKGVQTIFYTHLFHISQCTFILGEEEG